MTDLEALKQAGIDVDDGLAYCAEDAEFYEEMLTEYVRESAVKLADLDRHFSERNWAQYTVCAHSVKSMSLMIGAKEMAETARRMENAGKEGNEEALLTGHEAFTEAYRKTAETVRAAVTPEE